MKANKLIAFAIVAMALSCTKEKDVPTPVKSKPAEQTIDCYVQVTALNEEDSRFKIPMYKYTTDKQYTVDFYYDYSFPSKPIPVKGFTSSIEVEVFGYYQSNVAVNIIYKNSIVATDTFNILNKNKIVKWQL